MKKYVVKYKEGGKVFGVYASPEEASDRLMEYIIDYNDCLEGDYISPFDFALEEVDLSIADLIPDSGSAKKYLKLKGPNEKHIEALIALDQLFTIAEAWNKADGFVPDFSDLSQIKWFPWFTYDKGTAGFVCVNTNCTFTYAHAYFGSRLCFKSSARAEQFGKQFADLYNMVFLINK